MKNGHRWVIRRVHADGALTVTALRDPATTATLPADYVAAHTTLGYASTINAAQGVTADTCHTVGSDRLTRQQLYVALTRGRAANHLYFSTAEADPHRVIFPKATHPPTAVDILTAILRRDGAQQSAHTAHAADTDPRDPPAPRRGDLHRRGGRRRRKPRRRQRHWRASTTPRENCTWV